MSSEHVVIVGGSSGIGLATARVLLEQGFHVTIAGQAAASVLDRHAVVGLRSRGAASYAVRRDGEEESCWPHRHAGGRGMGDRLPDFRSFMTGEILICDGGARLVA